MIKDVIEMVVERIKKNRTPYEQSEIQVRESIVNPILRGLGWNPENPDEVQHNVSTEEGIPDYSLLKNNKKVLFIEAKKLADKYNTNINMHQACVRTEVEQYIKNNELYL